MDSGPERHALVLPDRPAQGAAGPRWCSPSGTETRGRPASGLPDRPARRATRWCSPIAARRP